MSDRDMMLDLCPLPRDSPYIITGVSRSQFSVARHYGGMKFKGYGYDYNPATDECVRRDVARWLKQQERKAKALDRMAENAQQLGLSYDVDAATPG